MKVSIEQPRQAYDDAYPQLATKQEKTLPSQKPSGQEPTTHTEMWTNMFAPKRERNVHRGQHQIAQNSGTTS